MEPVYILGGGRTDYKRNLKKEGKTIRHLITEAGKKAIDDAKIDPGEIQAGAVGNFNAGQFTKQLHLGAFIPEIDPKLHGIPTCIPRRLALPALFPCCWARSGSWADSMTPCWWSARSNKRQCRRSTGPTFWARPRIITSKNLSMAISCFRNCSGALRRFTSKSMALPKRTWRGSPIKTMHTPA